MVIFVYEQNEMGRVSVKMLKLKQFSSYFSFVIFYFNKHFFEKLKFDSDFSEQQEAEIDRLWEQRVVGAYLPVIPDISILTLNKCR